VRPGFKFHLSLFFFPRSVKNRRLVSKALASPVPAYSTWNLQKLWSWKVTTDSIISRVMKSHTDEHTICGGPTLKDVKHFTNGLVCKPYKKSIYEQSFWMNLLRIMIERSYQLRLSTLQLDKKKIFRGVIVILDVIVNQVESQHELNNIWPTRAKRLENLFTNVSVWVHLSKTPWETS